MRNNHLATYAMYIVHISNTNDVEEIQMLTIWNESICLILGHLGIIGYPGLNIFLPLEMIASLVSPRSNLWHVFYVSIPPDARR